MRINLVHCSAPGWPNGLVAYREVIDSIAWGLQSLGHDVHQSVDQIDADARNILFGAQMMEVAALERIPRDSVVYNFEQLRGASPAQVRPALRYCAQHLEIWEYSRYNHDLWKSLGATRVKIVPVGYAPVLTRIPKAPVQDIDVLFFGMTGSKRFDVLHRLSQAGFRIMFGSGIYGDSRDGMIARAKIILNINLYDSTQIFEVVRVSYLLANRKAVVAVREERTAVEPDLERAVLWTSVEDIAEDCARLLASDDERAELEEAGFQAMVRRDTRKYLGDALQGGAKGLSSLASRLLGRVERN